MNFSQLLSLFPGEPGLEGLEHPQLLSVLGQHLVLVPGQTRHRAIETQAAGRTAISKVSTVRPQREGGCCSYLACIWYVIMTRSGVRWIMLHSEFST